MTRALIVGLVLLAACGPSAGDVCRHALGCGTPANEASFLKTCRDRLELLFDDCDNARAIYGCLEQQPCIGTALDPSGCKGVACVKK